jgi:hypothetical protein
MARERGFRTWGKNRNRLFIIISSSKTVRDWCRSGGYDYDYSRRIPQVAHHSTGSPIEVLYGHVTNTKLIEGKISILRLLSCFFFKK